MTKAKCPYCGKYRNLDAHSPHCWVRKEIRRQKVEQDATLEPIDQD